MSFWKRRRMKRALKNCSIQFTLIPIPMASMCCIWQSWYRYENWNLFLFTQSFWYEIKNWFANLSHLVKSIAWTKSKKRRNRNKEEIAHGKSSPLNKMKMRKEKWTKSMIYIQFWWRNQKFKYMYIVQCTYCIQYTNLEIDIEKNGICFVFANSIQIIQKTWCAVSKLMKMQTNELVNGSAHERAKKQNEWKKHFVYFFAYWYV